ncbi:MAG TPA: 1-acyl-sn-glycerol-3-phosphate acyltransferase [Streptosporangiaceae bacterium]|nr:1-acyl-sn-glycerol-3-phosphate acyltransferase [Streptosporangiaceae bacterium]
MRPPPTAVRRTAIDPVWLPLGIAAALLLLAAATVAGLAAALTRRRRLLRLALFGALYLIVDVSLVISCALLWLRHPMPTRRDQARWSQSHQNLLSRVLSVLVGAARPLLGFAVEVQEPPDQEHIAGRPLLVLARHGGPGDSFALVHLLMSRYRRRPAIVLKEELRWDPGLDVILSRLPCCFVKQREGAGIASRLTELARNLDSDDAILLFPEGGNWTPVRHRRAIVRLIRAGRRQAADDAESNPNVLPPRPSGVLACLAGRPDLGVAIVAHTGLEDLVSPATVWRALPVTGRPMTVRWWYEPAEAVPDADEDRREWLRLHWAIVDSWIDARKAARSAELTHIGPGSE